MNALIRNSKTLGAVILTERKRKGLSQAQLGAQLMMRQSSISTVETGYESLKLKDLLVILAALDLDIRIVPRAIESAEQFADMM